MNCFWVEVGFVAGSRVGVGSVGIVVAVVSGVAVSVVVVVGVIVFVGVTFLLLLLALLLWCRFCWWWRLRCWFLGCVVWVGVWGGVGSRVGVAFDAVVGVGAVCDDILVFVVVVVGIVCGDRGGVVSWAVVGAGIGVGV